MTLLHPTDPADARTMGGKGAALARLAQAGFRVPPFVVVPPEAFVASLSPAASPLWEQRADLPPGDLAAGMADLRLAPEIARELEREADAMGARWWAVRSSAVDEDGAEHSFAGLLDSYLGVSRDGLAERVADVWRSALGERVMLYRESRGIQTPLQPPAVIVQALVDANAAGVAFGADPVSGDPRTRIVTAVHGLGAALVDGREEGETVRLAATGEITSRSDLRQSEMDKLDPGTGGTLRQPAPSGPVLTDRQAREVAGLTQRAGEAFGAPQDVEWAFGGSGLWMLQSRPITTIATGRLRVWDNSNIAESYGGVTTPLTFSFARRAYAAVYREFCTLLGVPKKRMEAADATFEQMLGLVRGRVYYNLASWYRVLALLPGYSLNAEFMEGMMGVREGIPDEIRPAPPALGKLRDGFALVRSAFGLAASAFRLPRMKREFLARVDASLRDVDLGAMDLDGLAAYYRRLEADLLDRWDAPLVNDFFAMIAFGVANKLADRWLPAGMLGHLLSGDGDIISAEPARRIRAMGESITPDTARALRSDDPDAVHRALAQHPGLAKAMRDYLARFGDRCLEELKLESPTLADDPAPLYHAVGAAALREAPTASPALLRDQAEARLRDALRGHPFRRFVFARALGLARRRVRDRENLRFERTRVFGRARRIVLAMGEQLVRAGHLDRPRDVFYLEIPELMALAEGTATTHDVRGLAEVRRAEFARYHADAAPPDRFRTRGALTASPLIPDGAPPPDTSGRSRDGIGCCAGVVEGPVRVVRDPRGVTLEPGTILVAERTDPGWILLFPMCAGLVIERGSLLSHSAIVAREMGIPAAVSVEGATGWLADGDRVRLDGATGRVLRLDAAEGAGLAETRRETAHA